MSFQLDLTTAYYVASEKRLSEPFLESLTRTFEHIETRIYQTPQAYELYLRRCLKALLAITEKIHPGCLEVPPSNSLFHTYHLQEYFIKEFTGDTWRFRPGQQSAYEAFAEPLKDLECLFSYTDMMRPKVRVSEPEPGKPPGPTAEKSELRDWERKRNAYNKAREKAEREAYDALNPMQNVMLGTPLFGYYRTLTPFHPVNLSFDIPEDRWFEGCWIVAASGAGKTNLLRHIILHRLEQDATIIILDSKGDLYKSFHRLEAIKHRLLLLDSTPEHPLAVNPFDTRHPSEFLDYLFGVFNTGLTAHQSIPFAQVINLLEKIPNPTMNTFWDIIVDGAKDYQQEISDLPTRDQRFFEKEFNSPRYAERRAEIQARLRIILNNKYLGPILSSPKSRVDMGELLDSGKVICVNNNYAALGPFGAEFLGRLFLALIWYAGRERRSQKPVYVFLDEAHYVIANDRHIDDMITQLRSKRISLTFAHQFLRQIDDEKVRSALNTCAVKFFNTTGEPGAAAYFPNTTTDTLSTIGQGSFATFVKFKTKSTQILTVPPYKVHDKEQTFVDEGKYPLMDEYEHRALKLTMYHRYGRSEEPPPRQDRPPPREDRPPDPPPRQSEKQSRPHHQARTEKVRKGPDWD